MKVQIVPILLLATLSKTDTAEQSLGKLDAMCDVLQNSDFALLKPSATLPRQGLEDAIALLGEGRSAYCTILRTVALHELSRPATLAWEPSSEATND